MSEKPNKLLPKIFSGNPLIEGLGNLPLSFGALYEAIKVVPELPKAEQLRASKEYRYLSLATLEAVYVPTSRDLRSGLSIMRMLLSGYQRRAPTAKYWRTHQPECRAAVSRAPMKGHPAPTYGIIGSSGSGKSTSLGNLLSDIPACIDLRPLENQLLPSHQLVWIVGTCPVNRTPRSMLNDILEEIDNQLGTDYADNWERLNDDVLINRIARLARVHFLGLLIIDEIQNVARANQEDRRLLKLLVKVANKLRIPVLFLGTPKLYTELDEEFADARRMLGEPWLPFKESDAEWATIVDALWHYQYTKEKTKLTPPLRKQLYELSQGIPAIAKALITFCQERLILNSTTRTPEIITTDLMDLVAKDELRAVRSAIRALRTGEGVEAYDDLIPKQLPRPASWEKGKEIKNLATTTFDNALIRASKKAAKEYADHLFRETDEDTAR